MIRGQAYGIRSIRVDGNDALAVYSAVHLAREMAISETRPILIEVKTFQSTCTAFNELIMILNVCFL